jgi:hypothetical protein
MKSVFITICALFFSVSCYAQTLNLSISNPQPRLGQTFTISVNVDTINKMVFRFSTGNFKILTAKNPFNRGVLLSVDAEAVKTGRNEIGPLNLEFNGIKYTTN